MEHLHEEFGEAIDMESVADSALEEIIPGRIVEGEIVTIDDDFVYVNVGAKSDGRVPLTEFEDNPEIGTVINIVLKDRKLVDGVFQFSKKAAENEIKWQEFLEWNKNGEKNIKGKVISSVSKGKIVDCGIITAFLPFSIAADMKSVNETEEEYGFKIKSVDNQKRSVILSRKDFLDEEKIENWNKFFEKHNVGDKISGKIIKFVEFGAFVRVDGVDALLHRNEMSWKNVFKQRKLFKLDEEREFLILAINNEEKKVSLGYKQLVDDPWLSINERYKKGDIVPGKIVTIVNMGAFVEIEDDVEGFIHNSDLSWTNSNVNAKDVFEKTSDVDLMILNVNEKERKLLLGLKQTLENPWDSIDERFPVDSVYTKKVKKVVKFGLFVELESGIDGLIHVSDISWDDKRKETSDLYKVGDNVEFKILDIKKKEMKISCGVKQLEKSPWEIISEKYPARSKIEGVISGMTQFGIFIKIEDNVEGLVHISEVSSKRIENLEDFFNIGDKVNVIVLGVDVQKKRLSLSIKYYDKIVEKEELKKVMNNEGSSKVTIGDMIKINLGE